MGLFLLAGQTLSGQDQPLLRVTVVPQILDSSVQVVWEQTLTQDTTAGRPVVVNLQIGNLQIRLTITPFDAPDDQFLLVVQSLVRQADASGAKLRTAVQSLLIPAGEAVMYFPFGRERSTNSAPNSTPWHQMQVEIRLQPVAQ
ncbi:MAG: hypothetical protein WCG80_12585 [Spirochaetales bacterium]